MRTLDIDRRIAGWGGFPLKILVWFRLFRADRQSGHRRGTYGVDLLQGWNSQILTVA